ncbi:MAG: hypothetical protein PWQ91_1288 [Eubacteriales bacterium]|nr:hypothetical protein [Eubacteriales bacterium]MDN5364226.1 hypothetical protein [Eubacteriales bacterium]
MNQKNRIKPRKRQPKKALITIKSYQRDFTHKIGLDRLQYLFFHGFYLKFTKSSQ